jgi:4-hydroxybenzoyl-CoA thioesterase
MRNQAESNEVERVKQTYRFRVEWSETDPATITFYPNFFKWFDSATWRLLIGAGLTHEVLRDTYGLLGCPIVTASAQFLRPARFWDEVELTSYVESVSKKSFLVKHELRIGGDLCAQGEERRVAARGAGEAGRGIEAVALPEPIRRLVYKESK